MENKYLVKPHQNFEAGNAIFQTKSVANRTLILLHLQKEETILEICFSVMMQDIMMAALKNLGNNVEIDELNKIVKISGNKNRRI